MLNNKKIHKNRLNYIIKKRFDIYFQRTRMFFEDDEKFHNIMRLQLWVPDLLDKKPTAIYAQMRPFRQGGNLLKAQRINGKNIVHNYGHGGAGISLAPGSAIEALKLAHSFQFTHKQQTRNMLPGIKKAAVIGSGVVGLFTAKQFIRQHPLAQLTIYAQRIPGQGKENSKMITSQVAPGYFLAYAYGSNNQAQHDQLNALSFKQYSELKQHAKYAHCIKDVDIVDLADEQLRKSNYKVLPPELKSTYKNVQVEIKNNGKVLQADVFKSIRIDMQLLIKVLIQELKQAGVKFVQKKINDLSQLQEQLVFNCCGLGSRNLFGDSAMKGIKGHLIEYPNPDPKKYNYFLKLNVGSQAVMVYMQPSRIILGLTREEIQNTEIDIEKVKYLQNNLKLALEKLGLSYPMPKL